MDEKPRKPVTPSNGDPEEETEGHGPVDNGPRIEVDEWRELGKVKRREFPGPRNQDVPLRVALEGRAYSDLLFHAKESLDAEICGVLVGSAFRDDEGPFVLVRAIIQGDAVRSGSAHVTFTQETWNRVHTALEEQFPKMQIVGWYHSHPGFGVEFSDMDIFIQQNFFPLPTQVALVTDPLGGETSLMINGPDGPLILDRFWVDGREVRSSRGRVKERRPDSPDAAPMAEALEAMENKLTQAMQLIEEQHRSLQRFIFFLSILAMAVVLVLFGFKIFSFYFDEKEPPKLTSYVPVPVRIGDKTVLLGIGVVNWEVPEELNALIRKRDAESDSKTEPPADGEAGREPAPPGPTTGTDSSGEN